MQVTTVGLDLAKNVFQVHGVTKDGEVAFNRALRGSQLLAFFEKLPPCLVGVEACGSSHHWARQLTSLGHEVRLIPAMYAKAYVKRGKSDAVDAAAICEAVARPTMRFVAIKSEAQQAVLFLHRAGDLIVRQRTQLINMARGPCWQSSGSSSRKVSVVRSGSRSRSWTERSRIFPTWRSTSCTTSLISSSHCTCVSPGTGGEWRSRRRRTRASTCCARFPAWAR